MRKNGFFSLEEGWSQWLASHAKLLLISLFSLFLALFLIVQIKGRFGDCSNKGTLGLHRAFEQWMASPTPLDEEGLKVLHSPELQERFGALIAGRLLQLGEPLLAKTHARTVLNRLQNTPSHFGKFALTSFVIAEGRLQEALGLAKALKAAMEQEFCFAEKPSQELSSGGVLYAYNLLRIAMLEKEVGSSKEELQAWCELEKKAGWVKEGNEMVIPALSKAFRSLQDNFREEEISLLDYIKYRKKELSVLSTAR